MAISMAFLVWLPCSAGRCCGGGGAVVLPWLGDEQGSKRHASMHVIKCVGRAVWSAGNVVFQAGWA